MNRGQFLVGGNYPVFTAREMRKAAVKPGVFLTGGAHPFALVASSPPKATAPPPPSPLPPFGPGVGARLQGELVQLMRERGVQPEQHPAMPLAPPSATPVLVRGVATRIEIDSSRTMMMPDALVWDPNDLPRLLFKHHPDQPAGEILKLEYVMGELRIEARVDHVEARRMPAFSVGLTPLSYEIIDRGGKFFHVRLQKGRLTEVSMVDLPALRSAKVTARTSIAIVSADPTYRKLATEIARCRLSLAA